MLADSRLLAVAMQRPLKIKVEAQDGAGQKVSLSLSGWKARIFQHGEHCSCVVLPMLLSLVVQLQASLGAVMILSAADAVAGVKLTPAAGLSAEHDHLAGVLFPDRVLPDSFDSIKPELIKMEEEFAAANPDMNVESISEFRYPAHN